MVLMSLSSRQKEFGMGEHQMYTDSLGTMVMEVHFLSKHWTL